MSIGFSVGHSRDSLSTGRVAEDSFLGCFREFRAGLREIRKFHPR
jgi:hypothetical protein